MRALPYRQVAAAIAAVRASRCLPYSSTPTRRLSGCEQEHGHQAGVTDRARKDIERASEYEKIPADDTTIRAVNRDDRAHDQGHEKLAPGYPLGLRSQPTQCATLG